MVSRDRAQRWVAATATAGALLICFATVGGIWRVSTTETGERAHTILERGDVLWATNPDEDATAAALRAGVQPMIERSEAAASGPMSWHERAPTPASGAPMPRAPMPRLPAAGAPVLEPIETTTEAPLPDIKGAELEAAITGLWVPDDNACSFRSFRDGLLPTIINTDGAWAGQTFCVFKTRKPIASGWQVAADCTGDGKQWSVQVRLTLKGHQLIWESRRGRQVYTRCSPDLRMADGR